MLLTENQKILYNKLGGRDAAAQLDNGISPEKPKLTINVEEFAQQLNISRTTAYKIARQKDFYPAFRVGNRIVVSVQALQRWINEQTGG